MYHMVLNRGIYKCNKGIGITFKDIKNKLKDTKKKNITS